MCMAPLKIMGVYNEDPVLPMMVFCGCNPVPRRGGGGGGVTARRQRNCAVAIGNDDALA